MGSWDWLGWVPGIVPPGPTQLPYPGYTPPTPLPTREWPGLLTAGLNMAVGLKSVEQLTLRSYFSVFRGMTEVYNLVKIHNR